MFSKKEWNISIHGDLLEREYAQLITEKIDAYGKIWEIFIGNQSNAKMANIPGISKSLLEIRVQFAEMHYTVFESIVCMKKIYERHKKIVEVLTMDDNIDLINDFIAFMAHMGRSRDNAEKICEMLFGKKETISVQLKEWYEQRNNVLHGRKIPFSIQDSLYKIARPKGMENRTDYYNGQAWTEAETLTFEYLTDFIVLNYEQMIAVVNKMMYSWLTNIKERLDTENLTMADPPTNLSPSDRIDTEISGSSK